MSPGRILIIGVALAGLAVAGSGAAPAPSGSDARPASFRIGLVRSMFRHVPESAFPMLAAPFRELMRAQAGLSGDVCLVEDAATLAAQLDSGETHLGVFAGHEYAWVRGHFPNLQPLALALGRESRPTANVVVGSSSPVQSLDDLKDRPAVLPRDAKEYCRLFAERRCPKPEAKLGQTIAVKLAEPASGADALDDVIEGKIPATVVDGGTLQLYKELKPSRVEFLRTLTRSEPFPATVIVFRRGAIDPATVQRFLRVLTGARNTAQYRSLMRLWKMKCFDQVPADYDQQLTQVLKAYPPPEGFCGSK
jgi:ABC-type phosphate/phosphonate transport system substrate-binding protein